MKKKLTLMLIVASLFAISHSTAAPFVNMGMIVTVKKGKTANTIEIRIMNLQNQTTHISIQDLKGEIGYAEKVMNQNEYVQKLNLKLVPTGEYILLVENEINQYIKTLSISTYDVVLYHTERTSKSEAQYVATNGDIGLSNNTKMLFSYLLSNKPYTKGSKDLSNKTQIVNGVVRRSEGRVSNINFLFVETAEKSYFQFFTNSNKDFAIENVQTIKKVRGKKTDNKMAGLYKNNR